MQTIQVSTILKPVGLRGEIKCTYFSPIPKVIYIDGKSYKVLKSRDYKDFTFLTLEGIDAIEDAERLRGKSIAIDRESVEIGNDEILTSDLIGFAVINKSGKHLGTVKDIQNYGASDICDCGSFSFPYEDAFVLETNVKARKIVLN